MASQEEIVASGDAVLNAGVEAALAMRKAGMSTVKAEQMLSEGLLEDVTTGSGPQAVLRLLSLALIRLADNQIGNKAASNA